MKLSEIIATSAEAVLAAGRCEIDDVVAYAWRNYGEDLTGEATLLIGQAMRRNVKEHLRDLADDDAPGDGQMSLPGLHLPSAIAVKDGNRHYYVRSDQATWPELLAGLDTRERNIDRAVIQRDLYNDSVERLRPNMEDFPDRTVTEAVRIEQAAAEAAA